VAGEHLITAGCSFTESWDNFLESDLKPKAWPDFLARNINAERLVNLGCHGAGNHLISHSLITYLETHAWDAAKTRVVFNISGMHRIDLLCEPEHPKAIKDWVWSQRLRLGWYTSQGDLPQGELLKEISRAQGFRMVSQDNAVKVLALLTYLQSKNIPFWFMIMDNNVIWDMPKWLRSQIEAHPRYIQFGDRPSMHSYCKHNNWLSQDDFHPAVIGHNRIAETVAKHLANHS
jgi:hypothetical protein